MRQVAGMHSHGVTASPEINHKEDEDDGTADDKR